MNRVFFLVAILVVVFIWASLASAQCCPRCGTCRVPVAAPVIAAPVPTLAAPAPVVVDVVPGQVIEVPVEAIVAPPVVAPVPRWVAVPRRGFFGAWRVRWVRQW